SSCSAGAGKMTTYSISLRHIKIHPMVQTELIPHRTRQGWNLVLQVRTQALKPHLPKVKSFALLFRFKCDKIKKRQ
ncbi:MAG: hypothetical protein IJM24_11280, partial [Clostridia bacterium]|nr:hypothetical protein [Clostridia bacterium]